MAQSDMPTMRSKRLGNELKRLRAEKGLKVQDAADRLLCGQPKISQIENGRRGIRPLDLKILLEFYGVEDEVLISNIKRLAKEIHKVDWWSNQGPLLYDGLKDYLTLESDSELVRSYEPALVPGLLQTEAYMRQIFTAGSPADRVELLVKTRLKRKELLDAPHDFRLRAIIDAPALHRISGSPELVREQLEHLLEVGNQPNVNIQILPLDASVPMTQYTPFALHSLRGEPSIDVAWLEHTTGGTLLEQRADVQVYSRTWAEFTAAALSPSKSQQYIRDLIKDSGS
ncbi:helix-turn-helix domain-containing protein [Streptomyces sp. NPDC059743]|uniref:helix-turn-helix domain-containing protein n=1 Tax=Streptomyces sp. NPDC059743 TaxID=3346928 RepID=UPI00365C630D